MRTQIINNDKLGKILDERAIIFKEITSINEKLNELDQERTKLGYKLDRLKEKTAPIVEKYTKDFDLQEFEVITKVYLNDEKQPEVEIINMVDEYAKQLRESKEIKDK